MEPEEHAQEVAHLLSLGALLGDQLQRLHRVPDHGHLDLPPGLALALHLHLGQGLGGNRPQDVRAGKEVGAPVDAAVGARGTLVGDQVLRRSPGGPTPAH